MPVVVTKPTGKASEALVELAYTLSGVKDKTQPEKQGKGLFGRILAPLTEEKTEVKVE